MEKTEKELQKLKDKVEDINKELKELSDEELEQVSGGKLNKIEAKKKKKHFAL